MNKGKRKLSMFAVIMIVMAAFIVLTYGLLTTDAFIDVGEINEMAGNDTTRFDKSRVISESAGYIEGLFASTYNDETDTGENSLITGDGDSADGSGVWTGETVDTTQDGITSDGTVVTLTGDTIDMTGVVGSTISTIGASQAWGSIDTYKDITVSGYRWDTMRWYMITAPSSNQYRLRKHYYPDWGSAQSSASEVASAFDSNGFAKIEGRYVVAVTNIEDGGIGCVGMQLDVYLDNGEIVPCIVGDIKAQNSGEHWCTYGHFIDPYAQINTIEFVVSGSFAYLSAKSALTSLAGANIVKIVRGDVVTF